MSKHPRIAFGLGDHVVIDNTHYAIVGKDDHGLLLQSHGDRITFKHTHDDIFEFYFNDRLTIVRGSIEKLRSGVQDNLDRTIDQLPTKVQAEIMRRHEYVMAAERFFARKLYPKRPEALPKSTRSWQGSNACVSARKILRARQSHRLITSADQLRAGGFGITRTPVDNSSLWLLVTISRKA
jgi:hypothetical protein